jgi:short-subunit dehydrogenase
MRQQRTGHIINFSSLGGFRASAGWGVYCSTKFAVEGITEALHDELAPLGIHATVVEPGFFRTDFMDNRSLARTGQQIADYAETVGATRVFAAERNHQQPGDPTNLLKRSCSLRTRQRHRCGWPWEQTPYSASPTKTRSSPRRWRIGARFANPPI